MRIGIDLGGTNMVVGLCDANGLLLDKQSLPTCVGDPVRIKADMQQVALGLCGKHGLSADDITHIGLGVPGSVDKASTRLICGTNIGMNNIYFSDVFASTFACPVVIENDANCAALGEAVAGAGRGSRHAVMITLGTGVGGGIVVDGQLYTGFNDVAGEIGHMVVIPDGWVCNCGRKGCLETYASATGMIRLANAALAGDQESALRIQKAENDGKLTAKMICDARDVGDVLAERVFDEYCMYLGSGLVSLVNILQPEKIIIGGGVAGYGEKLLAPLRDIVEREAFKGVQGCTSLVLATLGNDAGVIGAAML